MNSTTYIDIHHGADLPCAVISARTGAELLDISERHWHRLVERGVLPKPIRIGGNTRWKLEEVERTLETFTAQEIDRAA